MDLQTLASELVTRAVKAGATAADAIARAGSEFSTVVRLGQVETLKEAAGRALGLRVFFGKRVGSTYSTDISPEGLRQMLDSALALARVTSEDPHAGLPDAQELGAVGGDMQLYYD